MRGPIRSGQRMRSRMFPADRIAQRFLAMLSALQEDPPVASASSPLMDQYRRIKGQNPDAILFFRVGDFYEMFFDDAKLASRELEIVLTARGKDGDEPIPLAGIPYHAYEEHASRLLKRGFKVALCEQVGDPKLTKGIVDRQVVKVLTPGTVTDEHLLSGS